MIHFNSLFCIGNPDHIRKGGSPVSCFADGFFADQQGCPILPLGLQAHNSSTGLPEMLEKEIDAVLQYGGNLLEAPVYWVQVEKREGEYDFSQALELIELCRDKNIHLILLWFGINKNGHPTYCPEWVKADPRRFPLAKGPDGGDVATLSPLAEETRKADLRAFTRLMEFLRDTDGEMHTVLAVQVENEIGYANTDMDYSEAAQRLYRRPVPPFLRDISLEDSGITPSGDSWVSCFGRHAHEAFAAWCWADFVQHLAEAGKKVYEIPLLLNAMLGENGFEEPGLCYNSGGPVSRVLDIYKKTAPGIDVICPDIYVQDRERYLKILSRYSRPDNPLFVPESPVMGTANALNMMEAAADPRFCGYACFGAASALDAQGNLLPEAREVALSMKTIASLAPLIRKRAGHVYAIVQQEFMDKQYLHLPGWHVECTFNSASGSRFGLGSFINTRDPFNRDLMETRGRGLLIQTGDSEFYLAGCGVRVDFRMRPEIGYERSYVQLTSRMNGTLNFLSVEEGHFEGNRWVTDRFRNGDEANFACFVHRGEAVRIRLNAAR